MIVLTGQRRPFSIRDEGGQSLVVIVLAMGLILGLATLAIDVSQWYAARHQAQVTADSAALAAANCMASGSCTTDSAAQSIAVSYAGYNGSTITASNVTFPTSSTVEVTVPAQQGTFFSKVGIAQAQSESAVASWTWSTSQCVPASGNCAAVFAMASPSGGSCPTGLTISSKDQTITGSVHVNGSLVESGKDQSLGTTSYGPTASGCQYNPSSGSIPTTGTSEAPITTWPVDYTTIVTQCGASYSYACTGPEGTPSYCTEVTTSAGGYQAAAGAPAFTTTGSTNGSFTYDTSAENPASGQVWCAVGTGTASSPSTWNGLIYFEDQGPGSTITGDWIGGTIELGGAGWTLSTDLSTFPTIYATGSGNCSPESNGGMCTSGGSQTINGAIFAPLGEIQFNGAGSSSNFLEANTIDFEGGTVIGDGPSTSGGGTTIPGVDSLTQ